MLWRPWVISGATAMVMTGVAVAVVKASYDQANDDDNKGLQAALDELVFGVASVFQVVFSSSFSRFQSAAALFASEGVLPHSTFLLLAQPLRPLYKGVAQADMNAYDLIWAPFIEHSERAEFEANVSTASSRPFELSVKHDNLSVTRAPNASRYLPILDMVVDDITATTTTIGLWGVDLLTLPLISEAVRIAVETKKPQLTTGLCYYSPLTTNMTGRSMDHCSYSFRSFLVMPIVRRNLTTMEVLSGFGPSKTVNGPYSLARDLLRRPHASDGDVIGVILGYQRLSEGILRVLSLSPSESTGESVTGPMSFFLEDVTDVKEQFPSADCVANSQDKGKPGLYVHNQPFGLGNPIFVTLSNLPITATNIRKVVSEQTRVSQVFCATNRVWNFMFAMPDSTALSYKPDSRSNVMKLGLLSSLPVVIFATALTLVVSTFLSRAAEADALEYSEKEAEVGAYEQSMVFACDELEGPLQAITLSAIAQQDLEAVNAFDAVANNVEILSLSAVRMASRLKVLRAVAQETAGHLQFETIEFDVRRFVEELAKMHRSFASVPIRWRVDPLVPDRIVSAQVGIEQILANGLTNSCKFCTDEESGTIRIEVSVRPESSLIRFAVIDNGPGFGDKNPEDCFVVFGAGASTVTARSTPSSRNTNSSSHRHRANTGSASQSATGHTPGTSRSGASVVSSAVKQSASSGLGLSFSRRVARSLNGDLKLCRMNNETQLILDIPLVLPGQLLRQLDTGDEPEPSVNLNRSPQLKYSVPAGSSPRELPPVFEGYVLPLTVIDHDSDDENKLERSQAVVSPAGWVGCGDAKPTSSIPEGYSPPSVQLEGKSTVRQAEAQKLMRPGSATSTASRVQGSSGRVSSARRQSRISTSRMSDVSGLSGDVPAVGEISSPHMRTRKATTTSDSSGGDSHAAVLERVMKEFSKSGNVTSDDSGKHIRHSVSSVPSFHSQDSRDHSGTSSHSATALSIMLQAVGDSHASQAQLGEDVIRPRFEALQRIPSISARPPRAPHISTSMGTPPRQNHFGMSITSWDSSSRSVVRQVSVGRAGSLSPSTPASQFSRRHTGILPPLPIGSAKPLSVRMLVFEPDTIVSRLIDNWSRIGFSWTCVSNLEEVEKWLTYSGDLSSDSIMPVNVPKYDVCYLEAESRGSGLYRVCNLVQRFQILGCTVPFVAVVSASDITKSLQQTLLSAGFKDVILKPYSEDDFKQLAVKIQSQRVAPWIAPSSLAALDVRDDLC